MRKRKNLFGKQRPGRAVIVAAVLLLALWPPLARPLSAQTSPGPAPGGRPSVALVLAGGGAKGYAHIPVLELIEELNIPVDMVIGTSAGAIVGGLYCAGYSPEMMRELLFDFDWNMVFQDRPVFPFEHQLGEHSFEWNPINIKFSRRLALNLGGGFSSGQEAYTIFRSLTAKLPSYINFDSLPIPFRATAVELTTGKLEVFAEGDLAEVIRASMSIPAVFEPFSIDGKYYLDGGVLSNLPVEQAKAMGYDMVIAVELLDEMIREPRAFETSPLVALNQSLSIYSQSANEAQYSLVDALLVPDVGGYSILDFHRAREIYARAEQQKESFRETLLAFRDRIFEGGAALPAERDGGYSALPDITPRRLVVSGALAVNEKYIRDRFARTVQDRPLSAGGLAAFIGDVYKTGYYLFVAARIDIREDEPLLELRLFPMDLRNAYMVLGADFQETLASDVFIKLKLTFDTQLRGLTGPGSVLAFGFTSPGVLSFHGLFFQPLNQRLFFSAAFRASQDQDFVTSGFSWRGQTGNSLLNMELRAGLGYRFDAANTLSLDALYFSGAYVEGTPDYFTFTYAGDSEVQARSLDFSVNWEHTTLDVPMFPGRGIFLNLGNTLLVPLLAGGAEVSNLVSLDAAAALPVTDKTSLALNAFAGGDLTGKLRQLPAHTILRGFHTADRLYFPQIAGRQRYGAAKAAASVVAQTRPFKSNQILGADWYFALSAAAGSIFNDFSECTVDNLYWNAAFNVGIRFTRSFGAVFRLGAGKGVHPGITPVISLDLGSLRF